MFALSTTSAAMFQALRKPSVLAQTYRLVDKCCAIESRSLNTHLKLTTDHGHNSTRKMHSTVQPMEKFSFLPREETEDFMKVFPELVTDLTDSTENLQMTDASNWFKKLLLSNVGGNLQRGKSLIFCYKMLESPQNLTPENIKLAQILAWCVEIFEAYYFMLDDLVDGSERRRGQVCWHRKDDVGTIAVNDTALLEYGMYALIKKYFGSKPYYIDILEIFGEITFQSVKGQCLDMLVSGQIGQKLNINKFTMEQYKSIVYNKTSYYGMIPFTLAMYLAGIMDEALHRQAKDIFLPFGIIYQIQNDYKDCYHDPDVTGKEKDNDIKSGRCSWFAAAAVQKSSPEQKIIMEECYGSKNAQDVARIKALYEELGLRQEYEIFLRDTCQSVRAKIENDLHGLPKEIFYKILDNLLHQNIKLRVSEKSK